MTVADYIAIATIAAPLVVKVLNDWSANAAAKHNMALSRIVGMAGREAATIARTLAQMPAGADPKALEAALLQNSATAILTEMGASSATAGADAGRLINILQGELNKVIAPAAVVTNAAVH